MTLLAAAAPPTSCFTRMKDYLCKKETTDNMLIMASLIGTLASCIIPIRPLAGALVGMNFFVFAHKAIATGDLPKFAPRTWTQLVVGSIFTTGIMTIALSVPIVPYGIPTFLTAVLLGPYITYSECWELCRRQTAAVAPHYVAIPSAPPPVASMVSATAE